MSNGASFDAQALHPKAAASFDRRGDRLLALFERRPPPPSPPEPFESRRPAEVVHAIASDPFGELCDAGLRTTGWYYYEGAEQMTLSGPGYRELRLLVEDVGRKQPFRSGFSRRFLERAVITWCQASSTGKTAVGLASHLLNECSRAYAEHVYLVPLAYLEIAHDFKIGEVRLITVPPELFEEAAQRARERHPDKENAGRSSEELGRKLGNVAAVEVRTLGEKRFAADRALEVARDIAGVIRFMSPAAISATVPSPVHPLGHDPLPSIQMLRLEDSRLVGAEAEFFHAGLATWKLSAPDIEQLTNGSLANIGHFFDGRPLNDFAERLRHAFFGFCRAIGRYDAGDRLVGAISALECLLVRDESEPLQYSVADRVAFLTAHTQSERLEAVSTYKRAYAFRSGIVHRLAGIAEEEVADGLFRLAFIAFHKAITGLTIFDSRQAFLDGLDGVKFRAT